ncbi:MAG: hypothetical protein JNM18_25540 [Planctomycetaceae bacterium]|nr:hypothetical protein [Planctomycetaceae bacterium]
MRKLSTRQLKSLLFSNPPLENFQRVELVDSNSDRLIIALDQDGCGAILLDEDVHQIRFRQLPRELIVEPDDFGLIDEFCRKVTGQPMLVTFGVMQMKVLKILGDFQRNLSAEASLPGVGVFGPQGPTSDPSTVS